MCSEKTEAGKNLTTLKIIKAQHSWRREREKKDLN